MILATPAHVASDLLGDLDPGLSQSLEEIPHASTAIVSLAYRTEQVARPLTGHGYVVPRIVGGPVLAPPVLGATMLLFASAFAAYATARALVGSSIPLVTLQIADSLSSNVVVGAENLGKALALGMVVLVGLVMVFYSWVQRRTSRWLT